ncbi:CBS domain-containing protein [Photobacterium sp. WH77]|uniref:CBS domain-containing protein n=1 Tax=Photobacterium arenosum TaxID=2774143 RepID=A0ABR9BHL0_9GAMM|nr:MULTISPECIES: CBS domain-containing protein [Photobacterium]MBD8512040.1 CBS domain-containing protein [Photobacterium arenosum]MBV7261773.1 CBS domain-containing protein [Photobacterium sp. WH24]MCG2836153.1 CBS domain-containing protein [Photobacterium sp. WH77]MCG2843710.1 CBS domain-containing protein [Photobacterium sp. WH80]MDO6581141.1 CBS domain-containing protein [Photobacterium sp. 2_MG-2023]
MESIKVRDYMNTRPVTFEAGMSLSKALDKMLSSKQIGGPVVDEYRRVVGFVSEQDFIQKLLKVGYHCQDTHTVGDVMRTDVLTVNPETSIITLAETMSGQKPKLYPVVEGGRLVGIITRRNVLSAISDQIGDCFKHPV